MRLDEIRHQPETDIIGNIRAELNRVVPEPYSNILDMSSDAIVRLIAISNRSSLEDAVQDFVYQSIKDIVQAESVLTLVHDAVYSVLNPQSGENE